MSEEPESLYKPFEEFRLRAIPAQWARFRRVHGLENSLGLRSVRIDPAATMLYQTGTYCYTYCYIQGAPLATAVLVAAATERLLARVLHKDDSLKSLIDRAESEKRISTAVTARLHRLRA